MKMLIIEDEPGVADFLRRTALSANIPNLDIDIALSTQKALAFVIKRPYDLITLDLQMPDLTGFDIMGIVRQMCPHAIIAVVSGHIPEQDLSQMVGCVDLLLKKPLSVGAFFNLVDLVKHRVKNFQAIGKLTEISFKNYEKTIGKTSDAKKE